MKFLNSVRLARTSVVALAGFASCAEAAIDLTHVASPITHTYESNYTIEYLAGSSYGASDWPSFSGSLSENGTIAFTLRAPDGFRFAVDPHSGVFYRFLSAASSRWTASGASTAGMSTYLPGTIQFADFQGAAPVSSDVYARASADRKGLALSATVQWSGNSSFSFTSFSFLIDLAPLQGESLPTFEYFAASDGPTFLSFFMPNPGMDPGASMRLVSVVPEPSAGALMASGILFFVAAGVRRQRRVPTLPGQVLAAGRTEA